jgi:hypothetical protein
MFECSCPVPCRVQVTDYVGMYIKDADDLICKALKAGGRLYSKGSIAHSYPFCWRSDTPLIYRAVPSWFVKVEAIKEQLLANNEQTYWVPAFVKEKRFHNWLRDARDWAISRNRCVAVCLYPLSRSVCVTGPLPGCIYCADLLQVLGDPPPHLDQRRRQRSCRRWIH